MSKAGKRSYVFANGTSIQAEEIPELVWKALEDSSRLCISEHPNTEASQEDIMRLAKLPNGGKLADFFEPKVWARIEAELAPRVKAEWLPVLRPFSLRGKFVAPEIPGGNVYRTMVERHEARGRQVVVVGGADKETGLTFLERDQFHARNFLITLENLAAEREEAYERIALYRTGDVAGVARLDALGTARYPELAAMIADLAPAMIAPLIPELEKGGAFCIWGATGLVGEHGLLTTLRTRGFEVRRVGVGTPAVIPGKAKRWASRADCEETGRNLARLLREQIQALRDRGMKLPEGSTALMEKLAREQTQPEAIYRCLTQTPLEVVECQRAAQTNGELDACPRD